MKISVLAVFWVCFSLMACTHGSSPSQVEYKTFDEVVAAKGQPSREAAASHGVKQYFWSHSIVVSEKDGSKKSFTETDIFYVDDRGAIVSHMRSRIPTPEVSDSNACFLPVAGSTTDENKK
ncbi:MAG: hypothetical protein QM790_03460 [Nibricoccus sp.]